MPPPTEGHPPALTLSHTAQLGPAALLEARPLTEAAFDDASGDDDWDHALGGLHALVRCGGELVAHGAVVQWRLLHEGRAHTGAGAGSRGGGRPGR